MMKMKNLFSFHPGGGVRVPLQMQFSTTIRTSTILIQNNGHMRHRRSQMKCCAQQNYFQTMRDEKTRILQVVRKTNS